MHIGLTVYTIFHSHPSISTFVCNFFYDVSFSSANCIARGTLDQGDTNLFVGESLNSNNNNKKKGITSKTKKRAEEEEIENGNYGPPPRIVFFEVFSSFVCLLT